MCRSIIDRAQAIPSASRKFAAELVALNPDVIVATGVVAVAPLLQVTRTVPIVFVNVGRSRGRRARG